MATDGHHDNELLETILTVQLKHGTQIDVGLARSRFHFNREIGKPVWVAMFHQKTGLGSGIPFLDRMKVLE